MPVPQHARGYYTYEDYQSFPSEERWEIIEGVAYRMTPSPSTTHQRIVNRLNNKIYNYLIQNNSPQYEIFIAPTDVYLAPTDSAKESFTVVQPDIIISGNPSYIKNNGYYGAPKWIIEVLSRSTASMDVITKRRLYESNGVLEYWIVDPSNQIITRFFINAELSKYREPEFFAKDDILTPVIFPELQIDLKEIFPETQE